MNFQFRIGVSVMMISLMTTACAPRCVNEVLASVASPSGAKVGVLYMRQCGATTGPSTNVSVLDRNSGAPQGVGNVLVLKDPASMAETPRSTRLRWLSQDTLEVSLIGGRALQSSVRTVDGVSITYAIHSDREP
jgi:hypothetical protein